MSKKIKQKKGLIKGRSTAFLVSLGIHVALIIIAGGFVVFNIVRPEPKVFEAVEEIDRPKMKLKKLQVQVKENSRPRDSTERITTKTTLATEDVQLPPMGGVGDGIGGTGVGGFEIMEQMEEMTLLGNKVSVGNDLIGTFYHFLRQRDGSDNSMSRGAIQEVMREFLMNDWNPAIFSRFYRAPSKLYATQFFIPPTISDVAPDLFGDTSTAEAAYWLCHYEGKISHKEGGRFRFVGVADNWLFVRINGKVVLDGTGLDKNRVNNYAEWQRYEPNDSNKWPMFGGGLTWKVGNWFEIEPGGTVDMEVLLGEDLGGGFICMLCVQEEGVEYPERDRTFGPLMPIFKTEPTPPHLIDQIKYTMPEGAVDLTNGPIFNLY